MEHGSDFPDRKLWFAVRPLRGVPGRVLTGHRCHQGKIYENILKDYPFAAVFLNERYAYRGAYTTMKAILIFYGFGRPAFPSVMEKLSYATQRAKPMKRSLSDHQKQLRFLSVLFIVLAIVLFTAIFWISVINL